MEWSDIWGVVPFLIGFASGSRILFERFGSRAEMIYWSWPVSIYCISRGVIPSVLFLIQKYQGVFPKERIPEKTWLLSIVCGFSSELILRSRLHLYLWNRGDNSDNPKELALGALDLVRYWENYLLGKAEDILVERKIVFVNALVKSPFDFLTLKSKIEGYIHILSDKDTRKTLSDGLKMWQKKYDECRESGDPPDERSYCWKIVYITLDAVGERLTRRFIE